MPISLCKIGWGIRGLISKISYKHIGRLTYMGRPIFISGKDRISIGNRVRLFPGSRMEAIGNGGIEIEDDVSIGQNLHMISEGSLLRIGMRTTISANVFITNTEHRYDEYDVHIMKQKRSMKETQIGENCFLGYGAVIMAGVRLGNNSIVGANAVVREGIYPDGCVLAGVPAKIIRRYDPKRNTWDKVRKTESE